MKKTMILFFFCVFVSVYAQEYKKADRLFEQMRYIEAAEAYESAFKKGNTSMELLQKAGDAHYFNTDMEAANSWYDRLISTYEEVINPEYIFRYAHTLQGIGDFRNAKKWMKVFAKASNKEDTRIDDYAQREQTLNDVLAIPPQFELNNLEINTTYSDFGPAYYNNKLVYSSAIDTSYFVKRRYHWNDQPYLDFYLGTVSTAQNEVTRERLFSEELSTKYHEATLAFAEDYKRVYFTRNNYDGRLGRDGDGVSNLKLYTAVISDTLASRSDWTNVQELPFNSDDYSVGHPTVSTDGKQLYFVSDMPGSVGFTDIFVVDILGNNTYSNPKNLGPKINTSGREMFPFITKDRLYLASDGHLGVGGLDVFVSDISNDTFAEPRNLGMPLNSKLDDFGLIINTDDDQGFVCSNRKGGKGDDDIYAFQRIDEAVIVSSCAQKVLGYVVNARTKERIADATVALYEVDGKKISQTQSKSNGDYSFTLSLACEKRYEIKVAKTGYDPADKTFVTSAISSETVVPLDLDTIDELVVEDKGLLKIKVGMIYFDLDKDYIRPDAALELNKIVALMMQESTMKIRIESHTDARSDDSYNLDLSQRRAQHTKDYLIRQGISEDRLVEAKGFGETRLLNNCDNGKPCEEPQHQINRRSEFIIVEM